mmetsp:Transcript_33092/g.77625  ORF Transcript_33092/g.77625 Transcript_33092/m.77625 type:complete len:93 (-) Transcript_33092:137-415(-)
MQFQTFGTNRHSSPPTLRCGGARRPMPSGRFCATFFKFAFDGSGADNFFDAGSCIDGRLTSAWNWCSQVSSKPYYPLFKMCGFIGFDGEFQA